MAELFWDRIEPHTRDVALEEGLQTRIADTLWALARQWQVGEFRGEDAASPVSLSLRVGHARLQSFRNDARAGAAAEPFADGRPLESRVEAEGRSPAGRIARSAEAGLQLLRRLDDAGLRRARAPLRARFRLTVAPADLRGLPEAQRRRLALLARGAIDGWRALDTPDAQVLAALPAADRAAATPVLARWRAEQAEVVDRPGASGETWAADRLEHRFSVSAATPDGEVVLAAEGYPGGHLDWYAFDAGCAPPHGLRPAALREQPVEALPVPLTYPGMPASRLWELEEGAVSFGGIEAGPTDLARLVVAEYATLGADDWFLAPVRLPFGCVARVLEAELVTTFGERVVLRSAAQQDEALLAEGEERAWAFFELGGDGFAAAKRAPWLLVAPAVGLMQSGAPLEVVSFVRDEAANLGWAIEERVETAVGRSLRRRLEWRLAGSSAAASQEGGDRPPATLADAELPWRYRLQSPVPPFWIPLVPEPVAAGSAEIRLRRARLLAWEELGGDVVVGARGRILAPERALWLHEEELPATGVEVMRRWELARGADGRPHLWLARRKRPGRGERTSGLRFDAMLRDGE